MTTHPLWGKVGASWINEPGLLQVFQQLQQFIIAERSNIFNAVKNKHSDNDQSGFIFSVYVFGKVEHCLITCHKT